MTRRRQNAFTLLEVMFAITIFFMAMFAILGVFSAGLHSALLLRKDGPTCGWVASELSLSNTFDEGPINGDFGDAYPDYHWNDDVTEVATNGLFQHDIKIIGPDGNVYSTMSVLFYRPDSDQGKLGKTASWGRH
jgi:hypothetical protein